jgi:nucleotide-binding universal stress UspA family protein
VGVTLADMERESADQRVVAGIDGSAPSLCALEWAAREALCWATGLDVVHAWTVPYSIFPDGGCMDPAPFEAEARAILDSAVGSLGERGTVPTDVRPMLVADDPAKGLVQAAAGEALLVVGSRGRGGFVGLLLGSVSRRCVERASCPVAVIPPSGSTDGHGRIVVGVDGSEPSYEALHWAVAEAARHDARLEVVNAYDEYQFVSSFGPELAVDPDELEKSSRALLEEMVAGAVGRADTPPRAVELVPSSIGAARALLETAEGADLLVVGSRGRGPVRGLMLGSVSQQCVHHTPCPLVVVRPSRAPVPGPET